MKKWFVAAVLLAGLGCAGNGGDPEVVENTDGEVRAGGYSAIPLFTGLAVPSNIRFAPDGRLFYTELNTGNVRVIQNGQVLPTPFASLPTSQEGEQGVLGLALDPAYTTNKFVYVCYTDLNLLKNRVVRFTDVANVGTNMRVIVDNLPITQNHNGGRIAFGPDKRLYVTTGDNRNSSNSQNTASISGKILRYTALGAPAPGNPIDGNPMWALGLRNPFGLAFRPGTSIPYASENGPSCDDEINRIVKGGNYGWRPSQPCGDTDPAYRKPLKRYTPCIAPTGVTFSSSDFYAIRGSFLMCSLNDAALRLYSLADNGSILSQKVILSGLDGGLLDVTEAPDGQIYLCGFSTIFRLVKE
ncbi:MAG: sorbosone dehydrogenase family protein [Fimbriimonas sp.]